MNNNADNNMDRRDKAFRVLDVFGELFILNFVFILFSLPLFTIGASSVALYSETIRLVNRREGAILNDFIAAFKKNFKNATIIWLLVTAYGVVLFAQYYLILSFTGAVRFLYIIILFVTLAFGLLTIPFLFPVIARYENSIKVTIKNSFLFSISHLGAWIKIFCLLVAPAAFSIIYPKIFLFTWFLWITIMFALIAYFVSVVIWKVFVQIEETKGNLQ